MPREQEKRKAYPSDLTDAQGASVEPLIPAPRSNPGGRPREIDRRAVINTILYLHRRGCQGDMLPQDWLPQSSGYDYCAQWREDGTGTKILTVVRERVRRAAGREPTPPARRASRVKR